MAARSKPPEPTAPQPPWIAPAKAPRTHLSRDMIVEAALRVVDREGVDGTTMRRVADELNTGAASLYWHVRNREELLHLMLDTVAGEIRLPKPDPKNWQAQVKQLGREMRRTLLRHKDIATATMGRIPLGPNALRVSEWALGLLRAAGIPDRTAALVIDLFSLYVGAHAMEQADGEIPMPDGAGGSMEAVIDMYRGYFRSLPPDAFPNTVALADLLVEGGPDERFEFGLDVLVAGLAATAKAARPKR